MAELVRKKIDTTKQSIVISEGNNKDRVTNKNKEEDPRLKGREKKLVRKTKPKERYKIYTPQMGYFNNGALNDGGKIK